MERSLFPPNCRYFKEHEWVRLEPDGTGVVGITDYAQQELGDIVFLDLPAPGTRVTQFQKCGEVESVKAVSDIFSPVSGEVLQVNSRAVEHPELVNQEPYGQGWLFRMRLSHPADLNNLMTAEQYREMISRSKKNPS